MDVRTGSLGEIPALTRKVAVTSLVKRMTPFDGDKDFLLAASDTEYDVLQ